MDLTRIVLNFGDSKSVPLSFRDKSVGDRGVIQQIFVNKDYDLSRLARNKDIIAEYDRIISAEKTPLIIDCGANIGASALWFSILYPKAQVIAIEPEERNSEILGLNCNGFSNIKTMKAAISNKDETLYVEDPGSGDWGFRTTSNPAGKEVSAYSIKTIADQFPNGEMFIVKIDIEGGEARLFESNYSWIQQAMLIIVELHDWLLPGTANSQNCLKALSQHPRDLVFIGENLFSIRNHL